ncbi:hypothetical protein Ciccas_012753 [Cichlidogyrus casuarinus]|uniref:Uncharacterized protein n=1 Tax=Cichlidogyrus casuarinus TaxID=1844966 RepID=A0ABD2PQI3_9PLAT
MASDLGIGDSVVNDENNIFFIVTTASTEPSDDESAQTRMAAIEHNSAEVNTKPKVKKHLLFPKIGENLRRSFRDLQRSLSKLGGRQDREVSKRFVTSLSNKIWTEDAKRGFIIFEVLIRLPKPRSRTVFDSSQIQLLEEPTSFSTRLHEVLKAITIVLPENSSKILLKLEWFNMMREFLTAAFQGYNLFRNSVDFMPPNTDHLEKYETFTASSIEPTVLRMDQKEKFQKCIQKALLTDLSFVGNFVYKHENNYHEYTVDWKIPGQLVDEKTVSECSTIHVTNKDKSLRFELNKKKVLTSHGLHLTVIKDFYEL